MCELDDRESSTSYMPRTPCSIVMKPRPRPFGPVGVIPSATSMGQSCIVVTVKSISGLKHEDEQNDGSASKFVG